MGYWSAAVAHVTVLIRTWITVSKTNVAFLYLAHSHSIINI